MIGHQRFKRRLAELLGDDLPPYDRERMEGHLKQCADCRRELEELKGLLGRMKSEPIPVPDQEFWMTFPARVRSALAREKAQLKQRPVSGWLGLWVPVRWAPSAALAFLVVLALGFLLMKGIGTGPSNPDWASVDPERLITELAGVDQAFLGEVLLGESEPEGNWMEVFLEIADQEVEAILTSWVSTEEAVWLEPDLLNEIMGEEQI